MTKKYAIFWGLIIASTLILLILPRSISRVLFVLIIVGRVGLSLWRNREFLATVPANIAAHSPKIRLFSGFFALGCFSMSALLWGAGTVYQNLAFWLFLIGGLGAAIIYSPPRITLTSTIFEYRIRWWFIALAALMMAFLAEMSGQNFGITFLYEVPHHVQMVMWLGALILLSLAVVPLNAPTIRPDPQLLLGLGLLMGLGLLVRLWRLDSSIRVLVDEIHFTGGIMKFWGPANQPILQQVGGLAPFPQHFTYIQAACVEIFGRHFFSIRFPSAILGTLTIPAVFLLVDQLSNRTTAWVAAALMVTFPPYLHFSRLGLNQPADTLVGTLALGFMLRGVRSGSLRDYWWSGLCLGLTHHFYEGGKLFFTPLIALWLILGWLFWAKKPQWKGVLLSALALLIVALPVYYVIYVLNLSFSQRMDAAGAESTLIDSFSEENTRDVYIEDHLKRAFTHYVNWPDESSYYMGTTALVFGLALPFALAGFMFSLRGWHTPIILLAMGIVANAFGNSLLQKSAWTSRFVEVMPILVISTAFGLTTLLPLLFPKRRQLAHGLIIGLTGLIMLLNLHYYFGRHLEDFNRMTRFRWDGTDAIMRSLDLPHQAHIYIVGDYDGGYQYATLSFFSPYRYDLQAIAIEDFNRRFLLRLPRDHEYALFIPPNHPEIITLMERYLELPPPQYSPNPDVPRQSTYILYYIKPENFLDLG